MSNPVFIVPTSAIADVAPGAVVTVTGTEAHHAVSVVRLQAGEAVDLVDGAGARVLGRVVSTAAPDRLDVEVLAVAHEPAPAVRLTVVQAIPKGEHGELAVDLMTQADVDVVVPWAAQHAVAVWRGDKADRGRAKWQAAAQRAGKQARRATVPVVDEMAGTATVVAMIRQATLAVVLHESSRSSLAALELPATGDLLLVVGPEGGISDAERGQFAEAGAVEARMGRTVLRSSFAGAAALTAIAARLRWDAWQDGEHE